MSFLFEYIDINPKETIIRGCLAKKIPMDKLQPFCRDIPEYETSEFNGGSKFRNGDTIMARITPCLENGKTAMVNILDSNEVGFGSTEYIVFRAKKNLTTPDFVYYLICSSLVRDPAIKSMVGSSGRQRVQTDVIANLDIDFPKLSDQVKIAGVLKSLDDKIALNNAINNNLEQQVQAIFKSWFVDFEPFGGVIPNDWKQTKLGDSCNCILGGTPSRNKSEYWNGSIPWINSGEVNKFRIIKPSETITNLGLEKSATKLLPAKTTVLAITGATLGQVSLLEIDACANQSVVGIIPNDNLPYEYIYPLIKQNTAELISHQTGGAQQHINKQNVENLDIIIPTYTHLMKYQNTVCGIYEMIANNCFENDRLSSVRDTLLPKLMSGELDVSNVEI